MEFLDDTFLGNEVRQWLVALGLFVVSYVVLKYVVRLTAAHGGRLARATRTYLDDVLLAAGDAARPFSFIAVAAYIATRSLDLSDRLDWLLLRAIITVVLVQIGLSVNAGLARWLELYKTDKYADDAEALTSFNLVLYFGKTFVWVMIVLFVLQTWGVDVTALITGLGIGGVAVALAVQNVLTDVFASLAIIFDKPFLVGDFLQVGEHMGTVEAIGMKTTRLRSLSGEQLIFSNGDMLGSRIRNYGRMEERRAVFSFGLKYETAPEQTALVPDIVREIINAHERTRFDRCHFKRFGEFSLEFEAVYYMTVPDYSEFMSVQQAINLELMRRLSDQGMEFAYPTQTLYVEGANGTARSAESG
jgi:small-conductance mechanosensitive channel